MAVIEARAEVAVAPAKCGPVVFGGLDWDSSRFHVALAGFILEKGYGCQIEVIPGSTHPMLIALGKGDVDVLMEVWKDNIADAWEKLSSEGVVMDAGLNFAGAYQGFYVPAYLIKGDRKRKIKPLAPNLKTVFDLPQYANLFKDPEQPAKGRFYNCILGWACEDFTTKKLKAYGLSSSFTNFRPGTGAALAAAISSKYSRGEPFVTYYWGPTWVMGKYDLVQLEEPAYDEKIWDALASQDNPTQATAFPKIDVHIGVNSKFANENPLVLGVLKKYQLPVDKVSQALAYAQNDTEQTIEDAAFHFLRTEKEVWKSWVSPAAFFHINKALKKNQTKVEKWSFDLGYFINYGVNWVVKNYGSHFRQASRPILVLILLVEKLLMTAPWWGMCLILGALILLFREIYLAIGTVFCLFLIRALGVWDLAMQTLALMLIATFLSALIAIPLGICSAQFSKFRKVFTPFLDAMQTMPSFVFLIPALMLFGLGKVPAVFATVIYAFVPTVRLTDLGLRTVDSAVLEAATSFGASPSQLLWKVKFPLALSPIMAGINQTTMLALSMVVIASMIGARGLGEQVLLGIQKLDVGQGFTAGLGIVLLAIILDRLTQKVGQSFNKVKQNHG